MSVCLGEPSYPDCLRRSDAFVRLLFLFLCSLIAFCEPPQRFDSIASQAARARDSENLEEAAKLYRAAVQLRPEWAEGWWYLGTISYDLGHLPEAVEALSKLTKLSPRD